MRRSRLVSVCVALLAIAAAPVPSFAATPAPIPSSVAHTVSFRTNLSASECRAHAALDPTDATVILNHCYVTTTFTVGPLTTSAKPPSRSTQGNASVAAAASGCTYRGYSWGDRTDDAGMWRAELKAYFNLDSCNNIQWWTGAGMTCNYGWVWPWTVTPVSCTSAPGDGLYHYYTATWAANTYTASTMLGGGSHGLTYSIDPINWTYYNYTTW